MTSSRWVDTEADVGASIRAQAKVRIIVGLPVILIMLITVWYWGSPYGSTALGVLGVVAGLHISYIFVAQGLATRLRPFFAAEQLVVATAILDPLILSGWLTMMGESGGLFVCFYLFTILGFGFRIGPRPMFICQIASVASFGAVLAISPIWRQHPLMGSSFLILLIVVPLYATVLIKKLRAARAHAEHESQAKSQLLAKVSHELRTPLSGIVASAQLIAAEAQDKQIARRANTIMGLSKDLLLEIDDLLDTAKYEANGLVLESAPFDLSDLIERLRLTLATTAASKDIDFTIEVDDDIQDFVQGDAHYLSRVFMNLAGNAVKFTDTGKVEISLKLLGNETEQYRLRFSVQDTGIGIPAELHQKVFEPFFQISQGTARKHGGTGLGMSLAKEIVSLMGSDILVESEPGKGSLFYFDFKLAKVIKVREQPTNVVGVAAICGKRVLVADDNATNLILIKELLERDRHEVTVAGSGQEALEILNSQVFDIIFLDYNMGEMDGAKVLQIYRFGKLNTAPVFFLTADTTKTTAEVLIDCGAVGVLHKPITSDELRQAISQVCEQTVASSKPGPVHIPLRTVPTQYIDPIMIENLQAFSQRPEFLTQILGTATVDIERNCSSLLTALGAEDIEQVHDRAHALKGVSASVGAVRLASLANKLMRIDRWELKPSSERWRVDITETANRSIADIRNIMLNQVAAT